jgi:hypothetical protein
MFLVSIFFEIGKNNSYILKKVKKNPISFSVIKNGPFRFFSSQLTECLLVDPIILILVHIFYEIG